MDGGGWARRGISLSAKLLSFPLVTAPLNDELPIGPPSKDHPDGCARKPEHDQDAGHVPPAHFKTVGRLPYSRQSRRELSHATLSATAVAAVSANSPFSPPTGLPHTPKSVFALSVLAAFWNAVRAAVVRVPPAS